MPTNVNSPTDVKQKEADIARKLHVYGIFTAFQAGKLPSNDQIDVAMNSVLNTDAMVNPPAELSDEGKILVRDLRNVVKSSQHLVLSKNEGNLFQDFVWQAQNLDTKSLKGPTINLTKEDAKTQGKQAWDSMRTLGTLIVTNGQFRKLMKDATILFRDIATDAASNAATRLRPSDKDLEQMDVAADDNTWHEAPDFKGMGDKARGFVKRGKKEAQDVQSKVQKGVEARSSKMRDGDRKVGWSATRDAFKSKMDKNVSEEDKQKWSDRKDKYRRQAQDYFEKKLPKERRDSILFRFKKMILECQQHPDYAKAMQTILDLAEDYGTHGSTYLESSRGSVKQARGGLSRAEDDLKTLIERFANGTSTDNLWSSIKQIYTDSYNDAELRNWFKSMNGFIRRCLLEQGFILEERSNEEWDRLYQDGRFLLRDKYRSHMDRVVDEVKFLANQFDADPANKKFANSIKQLFDHLGRNSDGKVAFKPHLIKDIVEVIIPATLKNLQYIPIPRLEYSDPQLDAVVENLLLESDNFMPNVLEWASEHHYSWGRKFMSKKKGRSSVEIKVSGIQMDMRGVSYHVNRKTGFPSIKDTGVVDILLPGNGFSFTLQVMTPGPKDKQKLFKVNRVTVDIKNLKINIIKSQHKLLLNILKPIGLKLLRPALQKAVGKVIKDKCNAYDSTLWEIKQEADRSLEVAAREDPQNKPNVYSRYMQAFKKYNEDMKKKKESEKTPAQKKKEEETRFNMSMSKEGSIMPNIVLPGGLSAKTSEFRELAKKGDRWESPVFTIGSGPRSTDIPIAPRITRKLAPIGSGKAGKRGKAGEMGTTDFSSGPWKSGQKTGTQGGYLGMRDSQNSMENYVLSGSDAGGSYSDGRNIPGREGMAPSEIQMPSGQPVESSLRQSQVQGH